MSAEIHRFDVVVVGAGPAGQKAAIQAAKTGRSVLVIERAAGVGGECVHRGTIPSKTLRETAVYLSGLSERSEGLLHPEIRSDLKVESLMQRQRAVRKAHEAFISRQLERNHIALWRARARFLTPTRMQTVAPDGTRREVEAGVFIVATGSHPRTPAEVPVDHEHILDSDSILSLIYLPKSLTVLGAGVIACEFASIFAALGVRVTMIDKGERPVSFLDPELTEIFVAALEHRGGRFLPGRKIQAVTSDGLGTVSTALADGEVVRSDKLLCALGRVAQIEGLGIEAAGITLTKHGQIAVDEHYRTSAPHIYAVGDVIGPPSLAATSMEQGRRASRHALGLPLDDRSALSPIGIYTIPEMASVGLTEAEAMERCGGARVGRAPFHELARGQINGDLRGLLKLVAAPDGRLVGAHIVGEGATEIIHVAQMALIAGFTTDCFVDHVFNFPTLAEGYRVAALDIAGRAESDLRAAA